MAAMTSTHSSEGSLDDGLCFVCVFENICSAYYKVLWTSKRWVRRAGLCLNQKRGQLSHAADLKQLFIVQARSIPATRRYTNIHASLVVYNLYHRYIYSSWG